MIHKAGHNDLSRWKAFGGTLERPAPPAPLHGPAMGLPLPSYCAVPVHIGIDLAADDSGGFTLEPLFRDGRPTLRFIEDMLGTGSTHDAGAKRRAFE